MVKVFSGKTWSDWSNTDTFTELVIKMVNNTVDGWAVFWSACTSAMLRVPELIRGAASDFRHGANAFASVFIPVESSGTEFWSAEAVAVILSPVLVVWANSDIANTSSESAVPVLSRWASGWH